MDAFGGQRLDERLDGPEGRLGLPVADVFRKPRDKFALCLGRDCPPRRVVNYISTSKRESNMRVMSVQNLDIQLYNVERQ